MRSGIVAEKWRRNVWKKERKFIGKKILQWKECGVESKSVERWRRLFKIKDSTRVHTWNEEAAFSPTSKIERKEELTRLLRSFPLKKREENVVEKEKRGRERKKQRRRSGVKTSSTTKTAATQPPPQRRRRRPSPHPTSPTTQNWNEYSVFNGLLYSPHFSDQNTHARAQFFCPLLSFSHTYAHTQICTHKTVEQGRVHVQNNSNDYNFYLFVYVCKSDKQTDTHCIHW